MRLIAVALAAVLLVTVAKAQRQCNLEACPGGSNCADPEYQDGCCPNCDKSNCKFRGCVHFGMFPTWRPDPCTVCSCYRGNELCTNITCPSISCYGYPNVTRPHNCCPECDFGIARNECGVIPVSKKSLYVALGDDGSQQEVAMHDCDKQFVWRNEKWHICTPKKKITSVQMKDSQSPIRRVVYKDVKECSLREAKLSEIPADYDPNPFDRCALYVEPNPWTACNLQISSCKVTLLCVCITVL